MARRGGGGRGGTLRGDACRDGADQGLGGTRGGEGGGTTPSTGHSSLQVREWQRIDKGLAWSTVRIRRCLHHLGSAAWTFDTTADRTFFRPLLSDAHSTPTVRVVPAEVDSRRSIGSRRSSLGRPREGLAVAICQAARPRILRTWKGLRRFWKGLEVHRNKGKGEITARIFQSGLMRFGFTVSDASVFALVDAFGVPSTLMRNDDRDYSAVKTKDVMHVWYEDFLSACLR